MPSNRYERQISLFGSNGQARLVETKVAVIGAGGTGSHVIQQLAYLGICDITIVDADSVEDSNLNRLIGARPEHAQNAVKKVFVAGEMYQSILPAARVTLVAEPFQSEAGFAAVRGADVVFGCVDEDAVRLMLNALCQAYEKPLFDLATDVVPDESGVVCGGRVHCAVEEGRCLYCDQQLDDAAIRRYFATDGELAATQKIYGVPTTALSRTGPSVVSFNGVIASLATSAFVFWRTGLGTPRSLLSYRADWGTVNYDGNAPSPNCVYCRDGVIRGLELKAGVERQFLGLGIRVASQESGSSSPRPQ